MIRIAAEADIMGVVDLVEDLRAAVDGMMPVSRPWTANVIAGLIQNPQGVVFLSDDGFLAGCIQQTVVNPSPVAMELGWLARDRSGMALLRAFERWGRGQGAVMVKMSTGAVGPDLARIGYTMTEKTWVKRV